MNRRGFLSAILAAGVAPAVVKASSLMPVRRLDGWLPHVYGRLADLERYEFAEYQAAVVSAIAQGARLDVKDILAGVHGTLCGVWDPLAPTPEIGDSITIDGVEWVVTGTSVAL